jgi:hypothetical protein
VVLGATYNQRPGRGARDPNNGLSRESMERDTFVMEFPHTPSEKIKKLVLCQELREDPA